MVGMESQPTLTGDDKMKRVTGNVKPHSPVGNLVCSECVRVWCGPCSGGAERLGRRARATQTDGATRDYYNRAAELGVEQPHGRLAGREDQPHGDARVRDDASIDDDQANTSSGT